MYDVIDLVSGELIETGFDSAKDARRWMEANDYNDEIYGVSGGDEDDRDVWGFDSREGSEELDDLGWEPID